jgi:hypothetical protein
MKIDPKHPKTYKDYDHYLCAHRKKRIPLLKFAGKKATVYKKAFTKRKGKGCTQVIVTMEVGANTRAQSKFGQKCRAATARVIAINYIDRDIKGVRIIGKPCKRQAYSGHDSSFKYRVGEIVKPKGEKYDPQLYECSAGIHFFLTLQEAMNYAL